MKTYIKPTTKIVEVRNEELLAGSMGTLGRGYNAGDVSYGKKNYDEWDDEEDF